LTDCRRRAEGELALADLNRDGKPDLITIFWCQASVQLGKGDGTFQKPQLIGAGQSLLVDDFNGGG
jgi:hypothetical protein